MCGCESWTIKKAEGQRIDAFELWFWRRLLRVPCTARRSNQSILKEISPEYSLEGLMLKLKLPILWPPDVKSRLIWKDSDAGKNWRQAEKGTTEWDGWMASRTQLTWVWVHSVSWWRIGRPGAMQSLTSQRVGHDCVNWTDGNSIFNSLVVVVKVTQSYPTLGTPGAVAN